MRGTLNAHRLFRGEGTSRGYLQNINVDDEKEKQLKRARNALRVALRTGLPELQKMAVARGLIEQRHLALASSLPPLRPRFRMQGSAAYRTLNDPAHKPPQGIDYDDGVYLPTSFVSGAAEPVIAAKGFFKAVEEIVAPVCAQNGWTLNCKKTHCVRVEIAPDAHIDLPLYTIPDKEFTRLTEAALASVQTNARAQDDDALFSEQIYRTLPKDRIMIAHRSNGWIESDPRKIEDWFHEAIDDHGEGLRRVCRYFKGWRDHQWKKCRLTSLAIMACVVKAYDDLGGTLAEDRDDTALLAISQKLPDLLREEIPNPVIQGQFLDKDWTIVDRLDFVGRAERLHVELNTALNNTFHKTIAITKLQSVFGTRIPNDENLLSIDQAEREVISYKPAQVAAPVVLRSTSG